MLSIYHYSYGNLHLSQPKFENYHIIVSFSQHTQQLITKEHNLTPINAQYISFQAYSRTKLTHYISLQLCYLCSYILLQEVIQHRWGVNRAR